MIIEYRYRYAHLGFGAFLFALGLTSCSQTEGVRGGEVEECLDVASRRNAGAPVQLVSCPLHDTEEQSVRFFVAVRNVTPNPVKARIRLEPFGQFNAYVRELGGGMPEPQNIWESASIDLDRVEYLLPRNGLLGRVVNLSCGQPDLGPRLEPCAPIFELVSGRFEVWFEYADIWVCLDEPCEEHDNTWVGSIETPRRVINRP